MLRKYYSRKEAILAVMYNIHFLPSPAILMLILIKTGCNIYTIYRGFCVHNIVCYLNLNLSDKTIDIFRCYSKPLFRRQQCGLFILSLCCRWRHIHRYCSRLLGDGPYHLQGISTDRAVRLHEPEW